MSYLYDYKCEADIADNNGIRDSFRGILPDTTP